MGALRVVLVVIREGRGLISVVMTEVGWRP